MIQLFTHTDLDGVGCAILAKLVFWKEVDVKYCDHDNINERVRDFAYNNRKPVDKVFLTDISIKDELAKQIRIRPDVEKWHLLDHHPTALGLNKYPWCHVEVEDPDTRIKTSGTELFFKWLKKHGYINGQLPYGIEKFVQVVRDWDTWRWATYPEGVLSKDLNNLLYLEGREEFENMCIQQILTGKFLTMDSYMEALLKTNQRQIDEYIQEKENELIVHHFKDYAFGVVFADKYQSELGNALCKAHPEFAFIAMVNLGDGTIGYRTIRDDIDLGKDVAKLYGGGGHPKAAGSPIKKDVREKLIKELFLWNKR